MDFESFGKIPRLVRDIVVTEKIDGTNGQICVTEEGFFYIGSRNRWIVACDADGARFMPGGDQFGFGDWALHHRDELVEKLGPGQHFGEWWGRGIQRNYGLDIQKFSLFNTSRWSDPAVRPACCDVVPVLYTGLFDTEAIEQELHRLELNGSRVAPGFMKPEGVVIFHKASNMLFKQTIEKDAEPKGGVCFLPS